jgi:hypothetical protein
LTKKEADAMATIKRTKDNYRDFTFTPKHYYPPTLIAGDLAYKAKQETGAGFGHPPGPDTQKRDEFFYLQENDTVTITSSNDVVIQITIT